MSSKSKRKGSKRVGNGQGSIYRDSEGRWRASLAWMSSGKLVRKFRTRKTRREAETALDELKALAGQPEAIKNQSIKTMTELFEIWIDAKQKAGLSQATLANYRNQISAHLLPAFGSHLVRELTEDELELWLDGSSLGNATLNKCCIVLRGSLKMARKQKLIEIMPMESVHAPTWKREKEIKPFNKKEVGILLAAENHYQCMLRLMLSVGMRPGEVAALQWGDIDFSTSDNNASSGVIRVSRSRAEVNGEVIFKTPKTASGVRSIAMDPKLRQALTEHRDQRLKRGVLPRDGLVFLTPQGKVIRKNNLLSHYWLPLLKRLNKEHSQDDSVDFSPRVIYHCRHTAATLMLGAGVPVHVVSGILGHERISYTWDLYSHLLPEQQRAAVDARSEYL